MKENMRWIFGRSLMMIGILLLAIAYEQAAADRLFILLGAGAGLIGNGLIRGRMAQQQIRAWTFLADGILLIVLETYSRYAINLALQGMYILLIVDAYHYLGKRHFLQVGIGISLLGMAKFAQQITLDANFQLLSQTIFFAMVHILVLTTLWFSRSYQEEKSKIEAANRQIEALSRERERARLAREIHDSIGHSLTALIMQLEIVKRTEQSLSDEGREAMDEAAGTARQTLAEVRSVVDALREDDGEINFQMMLKDLIQTYQDRTKIQVNMKGLDDLPNFLSKEALDLFRIIQESLTNTARHGKAKMVKIEWSMESDRLILRIQDDGIGSEELMLGNGLTGMRDRVERLSGKIGFRGDDGFCIRVELPRR